MHAASKAAVYKRMTPYPDDLSIDLGIHEELGHKCEKQLRPSHSVFTKCQIGAIAIRCMSHAYQARRER
jgi:hypothetical protein